MSLETAAGDSLICVPNPAQGDKTAKARLHLFAYRTAYVA